MTAAAVAVFTVHEYTDIETAVTADGQQMTVGSAPDHFDVEFTVVGAKDRREALEAVQLKIFRELQS